MGWFSFAPCLIYLVQEGIVTDQQVRVSNIAALVATIGFRFILGPICDIYGPRLVSAVQLVIGGMLVCCSAAVYSFSGLIAVRFFIGFVGSLLVSTQFWVMM